MSKLIGIFILVIGLIASAIGLIASAIEIYSFIGERYPWIFQADDNIPLSNEVIQEVIQNTADSQPDNNNNKDEHAAIVHSVQNPPVPLAQWKQLQAMEKHQTEEMNEPTCQHNKDCQSLSKDNLPIPLPLDPKSQTVFEHWKQHTQMIEKNKDDNEYE